MATIVERYHEAPASFDNKHKIIDALRRLYQEGIHAIRPVDLSAYSGLNYTQLSFGLYLDGLQRSGDIVKLLVTREGNGGYKQEIVLLKETYTRFYERYDDVPEKRIYEFNGK